MSEERIPDLRGYSVDRIYLTHTPVTVDLVRNTRYGIQKLNLSSQHLRSLYNGGVGTRAEFRELERILYDIKDTLNGKWKPFSQEGGA